MLKCVSFLLDLYLLMHQRKEEGDFPFGVEDLLYYAKRVEEQQFNLDFGVLKQYFPVNLVMSGILKICQDLFGNLTIFILLESSISLWLITYLICTIFLCSCRLEIRRNWQCGGLALRCAALLSLWLVFQWTFGLLLPRYIRQVHLVLVALLLLLATSCSIYFFDYIYQLEPDKLYVVSSSREGKYCHTCVVALQNGSLVNGARKVSNPLLSAVQKFNLAKLTVLLFKSIFVEPVKHVWLALKKFISLRSIYFLLKLETKENYRSLTEFLFVDSCGVTYFSASKGSWWSLWVVEILWSG